MQSSSQFSLAHIWNQGDAVSHCVAGILITMSIVTWAVILLKLIDQYMQRRHSKNTEAFWHCVSFAQGIQVLNPSPRNPFYLLAAHGQDALQHIRHSRNCELSFSPAEPISPSQPILPSQATAPGRTQTTAQLHDSLNVSDWVMRGLQQSIDNSASKFQKGLALLASIGSTAPFIGLFGTVWGIYHALINLSHQAGARKLSSIELVAGPIGEALIMTALGLAVAIPAVLGYNALTRNNKTIMSQLNRFAHDLHAYFVTGMRIDQGTN